MQPSDPVPPSLPVKTSGMAIASLVLGILSLCCLFFLTGIPAVVCGIIGMKRVARSGGALKGRGAALAGAITGGIGTLVSPVILAALMLPVLITAREKAITTVCMSHLRQIGVACIAYSVDNGDRLPPDFSALVNYGLTGPTLVCNSDPQRLAGQSGYSSYQYCGQGLTLSAVKEPSRTVLAREHDGNHRNTVNVLFVDGHVETVGNVVNPSLAVREQKVDPFFLSTDTGKSKAKK